MSADHDHRGPALLGGLDDPRPDRGAELDLRLGAPEAGLGSECDPLGGDTLGLWYGVAGSALMIFAGLLAVHRRVPSWWWIRPRQTWLRGHIWLGLLSVPVIWCHSGFAIGGPLTLALWVVFGIVILSGVYGLVLQHILPRLIMTRVACEAPYEQIPHLCNKMRVRADEVLTRPDGSTTTFSRELLEVHVTKAGRAIIFFAAHFRSKSNDDPGRRLAEAQATRRIVDAVAAANPRALVVLGGDLNDTPGSPPLDALTGNGGLLRAAANQT